MILDLNIEVDAIVDAIDAAGGVVKWEGEPPSRTKTLCIWGIEVDDDQAASALPSRWFEPDELGVDADPRDIRDFVTAVMARDCATAEALLPRLFGSTAAQEAAVQVLRPVRRAA